MTVYNKLQCSVCRRIKDVPQDSTRATPNQCIITKGCSGFLFIIGETTVLTPTPPVAGLTDWYPRGQKPTSIPAAPAEQTVDLSTSETGILTLALYVPVQASATSANPWGASPPSNIVVAFSQQVTQDISYNEFIFNIAVSTTILQGKDSTGKNLRFSLTDVANGLVFVLVNGVASFSGSATNGWSTSISNQITFNTALNPGAIVTVSVYSTPPTATATLSFELNQDLLQTSGAWSNVRWVQEYDSATGSIKPNYWWLYSCAGVGVLGNSSRLKFLGVFTNTTLNQPILPYASTPTDFSGIRFLMASPPYDNTDRYLNFYVDGSAIANEYALITFTSTVTELFADIAALVELYPPFQLIETTNLSTSFISADTFPTTDSVSLSTPETRLSGTKILGPT